MSMCIAEEQTYVKCDDSSTQTAGQHCSYQSAELDACAGAVTCEESEPETNLPLQTQVTLIPCELLFFVQGTFGQFPESSIKTTIFKGIKE